MSMSLKMPVFVLSAALLMSACGSSPNGTNSSGTQLVAFDFSLKDAVSVHQCAYDKESDPAKKEELKKGLYLHQLYQGDEARFKREADPLRAFRQKGINDIAVKYQCPPS